MLDARHAGTLYLSAISAWEIATLVRKQRLQISMSVNTFIESIFSLPGVREAHVTAEIALVAGQLPGDLHGDPADRVLIATASTFGVPLVTRDRNILDFAHSHGGFACIAA